MARLTVSFAVRASFIDVYNTLRKWIGGDRSNTYLEKLSIVERCYGTYHSHLFNMISNIKPILSLDTSPVQISLRQ